MIIDSNTLSIFISTSLILAISPGPDNLFVITQSALYSWKAGLLIIVGLCIGLIAHSTLIVLGVVTLLENSPLIFPILKLLGACYLVYLAWHTYHAGATLNTANKACQMNTLSLVRRGVIMNISNPKIAVFFLAFLPQFIDTNQGNTAGQIAFLGFIFILVTFFVFGSMAILAASLAARFIQSAKAQRFMNTLTAVVLISLAAYMTLQTS